MNYFFDSDRHPVRRRFTLIELLVVVAILAILAGLLLPSLHKTKEAGKRIFCINNLKNFYIAFSAYAEQNNGVIVPLSAPCGSETAGWQHLLGMAVNVESDLSVPSMPGMIVPYPRNFVGCNEKYGLSFLMCPNGFFSYFNKGQTSKMSHYGLFRHGRLYGHQGWADSGQYLMQKVKRPSAKGAGGDFGFHNYGYLPGCLRFGLGFDWDSQPTNTAYVRVFYNNIMQAQRANGRHDGSNNVLYFDGHAVSMDLKESIDYGYSLNGKSWGVDKNSLWKPY